MLKFHAQHPITKCGIDRLKNLTKQFADDWDLDRIFRCNFGFCVQNLSPIRIARPRSKSFKVKLFVCLILYIPPTILQLNRDGSSWVEPILSKAKCVLLKDHKAVTPVRLEPAAPRSRVKHSTTGPLRSQQGQGHRFG